MASIRPLTREISYQPLPMYRDINTIGSVKLDLNSLCIRKPTDTFFIQVKNPNLIAWGIEQGDLLIVEKNQQYVINDLLVIKKFGEYKFYQFFNERKNEQGEKEIILFSLDMRESNLRLESWQAVQIEGVITNIVHQVRHRTPSISSQKYVA